MKQVLFPEHVYFAGKAEQAKQLLDEMRIRVAPAALLHVP